MIWTLGECWTSSRSDGDLLSRPPGTPGSPPSNRLALTADATDGYSMIRWRWWTVGGNPATRPEPSPSRTWKRSGQDGTSAYGRRPCGGCCTRPPPEPGNPRTQHRGPGPSPQASCDHRQRRPQRVCVLGLGRSTPSIKVPSRATQRTGLPYLSATQRHPCTGGRMPTHRRGRLSYERASTIFKKATGGWTLHQLRHSSLTHLGEAGASTILLQAKSRHQDPRTLAIYTKPGNKAIAQLTATFDKQR